MARLTIADLLTRRPGNAAHNTGHDEDPTAVTALWRAAAALRRKPSGRVSIDYAPSERRRRHPSSTELRRAIRRLEQQVFAARGELARRRARTGRRVALAVCVAAACVALFASAVSLALGVRRGGSEDPPLRASRPTAVPMVADSAAVTTSQPMDVAEPVDIPDARSGFGRAANTAHANGPSLAPQHRRRRHIARVTRAPHASPARRAPPTERTRRPLLTIHFVDDFGR